MKSIKTFLATVSTLLLASAPAIASEVELTFSDSAFQCYSNAPQTVFGIDVYDDGELVAEDMRIGDSVIVSSLDNVSMEYFTVANGCGTASPTELLVTEESDIPNLAGAYSQASIVDMLAQIEDYEDLYLVELGTTYKGSAYYDLQDIIITVNNEPELPNDEPDNPPAPDLSAYAD